LMYYGKGHTSSAIGSGKVRPIGSLYAFGANKHLRAVVIVAEPGLSGYVRWLDGTADQEFLTGEHCHRSSVRARHSHWHDQLRLPGHLGFVELLQGDLGEAQLADQQHNERDKEEF